MAGAFRTGLSTCKNITINSSRYSSRIASTRNSSCKRTFSSSSSSSSSTPSNNTNKKQSFCLLDLRESELSVIERLCLEECLLRHDSRQWIIFGTHHPTKSKHLNTPPQEEMPTYLLDNNNNDDENKNDTTTADPCIVVMGIGGKPALLLNTTRVQEDGIWVLKRFSGGGTVVVDRNCLYTTIIGRNDQLTHIPPYPREIMAWTATDVFEPLFQGLKEQALLRSSSCSSTSSSPQQPSDYPDFALRENDYVLGSTQKVAGNAQSIVQTGFLHHTTFLWSYKEENMEYLTLPAKRPDYRRDRSHSKFLIQLKDAYHDQLVIGDFFDNLETVCHDSFDVEEVSLDEALAVVQDVVGPGGLQAFFETKSRTKLIDVQ